jgi:hypothetical protein
VFLVPRRRLQSGRLVRHIADRRGANEVFRRFAQQVFAGEPRHRFLADFQ